MVATLLAPGQARALTASLSYEPATPLTHEQVTFTSTSTPDPETTIVSEEWDLDDDGEYDDATGPSATWKFARPGPHRVVLRVVDSLGGEDARSRRIMVANRPPLASFFSTPAELAPGEGVALVSTAFDPDGFIASQSWDLDGDGGFDDGAGSFASLSFPVAGKYGVGLRVIDDDGAVAETAGIVTVAGVSAQVGSRGPLMSPFPVVRVSGIVRKRGIKLRLLSVSAPVGARVRVHCRGGGCPFKSRVRRVGSKVKSGARVAPTTGLVRIRRFGRRLLRAGAVIRVFVTREGVIGKYTRLRVRAGTVPARVDRCLPPGLRAPQPCPSG
jgi:PKD domain